MKTLLLTVDALRADHLSQYGYHRSTMPAVDLMLDGGGEVLEDVFANGSNTAVSLPSLLTSRYRGLDTIAAGPTIASVLNDEGVTTAAFHSNTLFENSVPDVAGFDTYDSFGVTGGESADTQTSIAQTLLDATKPLLRRTGVLNAVRTIRNYALPARYSQTTTQYTPAATITDIAGDWIADHATDDFFLWAHYMDPHRPYGIDLDDPEYGPSLEKTELLDLMAQAGKAPNSISEDERDLLIDIYDSDLRYTSTHLERLFDRLQNLGIWEETAIILTADHGEEFREHGHFFHRNRPYDELVRVPLVVKTDHVDLESQSPRELLDVAPTICDLHGVTPPEKFQGTSLASVRDGPIISRGSIIDETPAIAVRDDEWTGIWSDAGTELYEPTSDEFEQQDVSADNPNVVEEYLNKIPQTVLEAEAPQVLEAKSDEVEQRLADLGYLDT